jgi:RNA polymerase sigma-70 factor (ECF subfamily)
MRSPKLYDAPATLHLPGLIDRCLRHERSAFRQLVEEHQHYVFVIAFRVLRNEEDARDVTQETFIRVWKNLHTYDMRTKFTTWLYTIAVNLAYDQLKGNRRKHRWLSVIGSPELDSVAAPMGEEARIVNRDLAGKIAELAGELPPKQQKVFILRDLQDLSVDEVARVLSISVNSVKTNLCYARRSIRAKMHQMEDMKRRSP